MNRTTVVTTARAAAGFCAAALFALLTGCAPVPSMTALVRMMPDQELYFKNQVLPPFDKQYHADISVVHYENIDSLEDYVRRYSGTLCLVKVPFDNASSLIKKGLFKRLDSFLSADEAAKFKADYLLTDLGADQGKPCLIPRKFETRIMVFCKSRVVEAAGIWKEHEKELNQALRQYNGYGLPAQYTLEENPGDWDYFDFFVVGWIWAHHPYNGTMSGRIGLRGKRYSGTWLGVVDRVFQCNGDSASVISMSGDPVVDAMHWEAVYASSGVYNAKMWEKGWSGADVWQGFAQGEVFLSFMTQLDCFFLHGTGRDNINGYFKNPDDMGVALMPQGCSVALSPAGEPLRVGKRSITTGGWWWGIPASTPHPELSFQLAGHITSTSSQIQECTRFGMIPVRKDVLSDITMMFGGGWIADIYDVSFRQLMQNGYTALPAHPQIGKIGALYLEAWYDMVAGKNWSADKSLPQRDYIRDRLASVYRVRADRVLAGLE
jgi:hypothetical protein